VSLSSLPTPIFAPTPTPTSPALTDYSSRCFRCVPTPASSSAPTPTTTVYSSHIRLTPNPAPTSAPPPPTDHSGHFRHWPFPRGILTLYDRRASSSVGWKFLLDYPGHSMRCCREYVDFFLNLYWHFIKAYYVVAGHCVSRPSSHPLLAGFSRFRSWNFIASCWSSGFGLGTRPSTGYGRHRSKFISKREAKSWCFRIRENLLKLIRV
jgi:hypothetical protein